MVVLEEVIKKRRPSLEPRDGPEQSEAPYPTPVFGMSTLLAFPALEAAQGHGLVILSVADTICMECAIEPSEVIYINFKILVGRCDICSSCSHPK